MWLALNLSLATRRFQGLLRSQVLSCLFRTFKSVANVHVWSWEKFETCINNFPNKSLWTLLRFIFWSKRFFKPRSLVNNPKFVASIDTGGVFSQLLLWRGRFGEPGKKLSLLLTQVLLPRGLTGVRSTTVAFEVGFPFQCLLSSKGTGREKSFWYFVPVLEMA